MKKRIDKDVMTLIISIIMMFVWIFVIFVLTGGKETEDFTKIDNYIFTAFICVELLNVIILFVFAVKVGKKYSDIFSGKTVYTQIETSVSSREQKAIRRNSDFIYVLGFVLALGFSISGIIVKPYIPTEYGNLCIAIFVAGYALFGLMFPLNIILTKRKAYKFNKMNFAEMQAIYLRQREMAESAAEKKHKLLKRLRISTYIYTVFLGAIAAVTSFLAGVITTPEDFYVLLVMASMLLFWIILSRIRFSYAKYVFDNEMYVLKKDYIKIHEIAERAAKAIGCKGDIRIAFLVNNSAGIAKIGKAYSLQIGVFLLAETTEEELYHIFLHEFAHIKNSHEFAGKERDYHHRICECATPNFMSGVANILFRYFDMIYSFEFNLYDYAVSLLAETEADKAMAEHGNPEIAASSLLKLGYFHLSEWEKVNSDKTSFYKPEKMAKTYVHGEIEEFKRERAVREEAWNEILKKEIISRNSTHPTTKMRIESLGINEYKTVETENSKEYQIEVEKAIDFLEEFIYENNAEDYEAERHNKFVEPNELIENWKAGGKQIVAEEYADVVYSLRELGRFKESEEVCDRAIKELTHIASAYACLIKGVSLLHRYDIEGIDYIYRAIETNSKAIDYGLEEIGHFCCLMGLEKELHEYREKAIELAEKQRAEYSKIGYLSKNDDLSAEKLPDGMLDKILNFILSVEDGAIDEIYLVRKTISESFFTSAFVISFYGDVTPDIRQEVMHKVFNFLDTFSNRQFSLFDYDAVKNVGVRRINGALVYTSPLEK